MELANKLALVTGASKGIGKATAIALAREGASVMINYNSDEKGAKKTLEECNKLSKGNLVFKADIRKEEDVEKLFEEIGKKFEGLDILVNNAGIFSENDGPRNITAFEETFQTNFLAHVRVSSFALAIMKAGKIVNVSSIHGRLGHGRPGAIAYSAMKAAMDSYTKNLAKAVAPRILVNAVAPGQVLTPMWGVLSKEEVKEFGKDQLIKRFILPEEIADAVVFLVKNDAMCGEVLTIDGGMSLKEFR